MFGLLHQLCLREAVVNEGLGGGGDFRQHAQLHCLGRRRLTRAGLSGPAGGLSASTLLLGATVHQFVRPQL